MGEEFLRGGESWRRQRWDETRMFRIQLNTTHFCKVVLRRGREGNGQLQQVDRQIQNAVTQVFVHALQ